MPLPAFVLPSACAARDRDAAVERRVLDDARVLDQRRGQIGGPGRLAGVEPHPGLLGSLRDRELSRRLRVVDEQPCDGAVAKRLGPRALGDPRGLHDDACGQLHRLRCTLVAPAVRAVEERRRERKGHVDPDLRIPAQHRSPVRDGLGRSPCRGEPASEDELGVVMHGAAGVDGGRPVDGEVRVPGLQVGVGGVERCVGGERTDAACVGGGPACGIEGAGSLLRLSSGEQRASGTVRPCAPLMGRAGVGHERRLGLGEGAHRRGPIVIGRSQARAHEAGVGEERVQGRARHSLGRWRRCCDVRHGHRPRLGFGSDARSLTSRLEATQGAARDEHPEPPLHRRGRHASVASSSVAASAFRWPSATHRARCSVTTFAPASAFATSAIALPSPVRVRDSRSRAASIWRACCSSSHRVRASQAPCRCRSAAESSPQSSELASSERTRWASCACRARSASADRRQRSASSRARIAAASERAEASTRSRRTRTSGSSGYLFERIEGRA